MPGQEIVELLAHAAAIVPGQGQQVLELLVRVRRFGGAGQTGPLPLATHRLYAIPPGTLRREGDGRRCERRRPAGQLGLQFRDAGDERIVVARVAATGVAARQHDGQGAGAHAQRRGDRQGRQGRSGHGHGRRSGQRLPKPIAPLQCSHSLRPLPPPHWPFW